MMLIQTDETCPQCDQRIYMMCFPKRRDDDSLILTEIESDGAPHAIADGIYLDRSGVCCIVPFDKGTRQPEYYCIHCRWHS